MKSLEELRAIRAKMQGKVGVRAENENQIRVVVGMATCGIASGARPVLTALFRCSSGTKSEREDLCDADRLYRSVPV